MSALMKYPLIDYKEIESFLREKFPQSTDIRFEAFRIKGESGIGRIRLEFDNAKAQRLWIKINRVFFTDQEKGRKIGEESYEVLVKLYDSFSEDGILNIVKPLYYASRWGAVITQSAPGVSLVKIVYRYLFSLNLPIFLNKRALRQILFNCGLWIAELQKITESDKELAGIELDLLEESGIRRDLSCLEQIKVHRNSIEELREYLFNFLTSVKKLSFKAVGCHIDFSPRNILTGKEGRIIALDFDKFSYRWPYDNVAMFMVYLDSLRKYFFIDRHRLDKLKGFFLDGYRSKARLEIDDDILRFFQARYMILMVANELSFVQKRRRIWRWFILKRMANLLECWLNENIFLSKQIPGG